MRSRAEVREHAAQHESEQVVQYVDALLEEQDELLRGLDSVTRRGLSNDGRATLVLVAKFLIIAASAYMMTSR